MDTFTFASSSDVKTAVNVKVWVTNLLVVKNPIHMTDSLTIEADWRDTRRRYLIQRCSDNLNCDIVAPT